MTASPVEAALVQAREQPRSLTSPDGQRATIEAERMASNFAAITAELDGPRQSRLARILLRIGVSDRVVPLVTATPALRRSWFFAMAVAILFALNASGSSTADPGVDRIVVFLTAAPLIPLVGVALAFGPAVDPTHEIAVAAPVDGFRLFLLRALTVVSASTLILLVASVLIQEGGGYRIAWLLPALAATALTMALSTRLDPRVAAGIVAAAWLTVVLVIVQAVDTAAAFGPVVQLLSLMIGVLSVAVFYHRRRRLDLLSVD